MWLPLWAGQYNQALYQVSPSLPSLPQLLPYQESAFNMYKGAEDADSIHFSKREEYIQQENQLIFTCIMCLAVLSSLLNLIRGGTSGMEAEASWGTDSTGFPNVAKHLWVVITAGNCCKLGVGTVKYFATGTTPLLLGGLKKLVLVQCSFHWKMEKSYSYKKTYCQIGRKKIDSIRWFDHSNNPCYKYQTQEPNSRKVFTYSISLI